MRFIRPIALATVAVLTLTSLVMYTGRAEAADKVESITLSPVAKNYEVKPGQIIHDTVTILNDGQTAYDFTIYGAPYSVSNGAYDPSFASVNPDADAYTWLQFAKTTYHIEPRQTIKVPYTVQVKSDAAPGGHYGAIMAEVEPGDDAGQLARKKRVASIVYATVAGDVKLAGSVTAIDVPWYQSTTPLTASATVKNTGNTHFTSTVDYQVSDLLGRTVYQTKGDYTVLPNTTRNIAVQWNDAAWFGLYHVNFTTNVLGHNTTTSTFVLIMPIWLIVLLFVALAIGGAYGLSRRSYRSTK